MTRRGRRTTARSTGSTTTLARPWRKPARGLGHADRGVHEPAALQAAADPGRGGDRPAQGRFQHRGAHRPGEHHTHVHPAGGVEHVPSPVEHLERACARVAEGGALYVQTPDAHHIDLARAGSARQVLQQPHHRHLVKATWLVGQLRRLGFELVVQTHRPSFHTRIPFLTLPTLDYHLDRHGGLTAPVRDAVTIPERW
jgi:hypothetical protein